MIFGQDPDCGDWALCVLAGLREELARLERQRKQDSRAQTLIALSEIAIGRVAISADRSPVV